MSLRIKLLLSSGLALVLLSFSACVAPPTKIYESTAQQSKGEAGAPVVRPGAVLIDARPDFEFSVAHAPGAISMHWEDFAQKEYPFFGELDLELFTHARRLARYGVRPFTPVVIIGNGLKGDGAEARLAWTLKYMGLQDVKIVNQKYVSVPRLNGEVPDPVSLPLWKPEIDDTLLVTKDVFESRMKKVDVLDRPVLIDVRPVASFSGKDKSKFSGKVVDGAINLPWTEFFEEDGALKVSVIDRLTALHVKKDQLIYLIDEQGVRSAAVTWALRELGYTKSANFAGGYLELLAGRR
jgi:thiosulfate/3-mercaptopyruvate sulfurtransferase